VRQETALPAQRQPLRHAEAVLLVHDGQRQPGKDHRILDQRMRADQHVHLNVKAPYFLTQRLLPALISAQGNVINISSYFAHRMLPGRTTTAYSMTKGAMNAFTRALAFEVGHLGVRVNAIAPGSVETPQLQHNLQTMPVEGQQAFHNMIRTIYPLQRIGRIEDIGQAAVFLASATAGWITGTVLAVDGGLTTN